MGFKNFKTGIYKPTGNYVGNKPVKYRSSYELEFCKVLDAANCVASWDYECIWIRYRYRGKPRSYLVDFIVTLTTGQKFLIEVKPRSFYDRAMQTRDMNWHKWNAAISFCQQRNWQFKVITEQSIPVLAKLWCKA